MAAASVCCWSCASSAATRSSAAALAVCCGLRGVDGLAIELVLEASDFGSAFCRVIRRGARFVLRCLKLGFELRDPLVDLLLGAG